MQQWSWCLAARLALLKSSLRHGCKPVAVAVADQGSDQQPALLALGQLPLPLGLLHRRRRRRLEQELPVE